MADAVNDSDSPPPTKKRAVCQKRVKENDRSLNMTAWLKFDSDKTRHVSTLSCKVCRQYKDKLLGIRNYNLAFVDGTSNVRASSFKDHAVTDMDKCAMAFFRNSTTTITYGVTNCNIFTPFFDGSYDV